MKTSMNVERAEFIKSASENPVLWTEMKGVSAETKKSEPDAE
jgi:hypothetical protein